MASLTRTQLIARGLVKAARKGQATDLTIEFDEILRDITKQQPVWIPLPKAGSIVLNQETLDMPSDFRSRDYFIMDTDGSPITLSWREPYVYFKYVRTLASSEPGKPRIYTVQKNHKKVYFYPPADQTYDYEVSYAAIHPKAGISINFTSGGAYEIVPGNTITGVTSTATGVVRYVHLTNGSWAGEDAEGTLILSATTGTFGDEDVKVGLNLNVATVDGPVITADNFTHFLGEDFDDLIILGLAWKASELISDLRERAPYWKNEYLNYMEDVYNSFKQTTIIMKNNVWNRAWNRRVR